MSDWIVSDIDGMTVWELSADGVSNARILAFNLLVSHGIREGRLVRVLKDGLKDVCWLDTVVALYHIAGSEDGGWRPIVRKLSLVHDERWLVTDAVLVSRENIGAYAGLHGIENKEFLVDDPQLCWCRTLVSRDGSPIYEFFSERIPRSFRVWVCRRRTM